MAMRFGAALFGLIFGIAWSGRAASAQDASRSLDVLLARVRSATGAPYSAHIVSEASETEGDRTYTLRLETEGYRALVRRCREAVCAGEYFDGDRAYSVNLNDTALPNSLHGDDEARVMRAITSGAFASPDFRATGGLVSERAPVARGGRTYRRLTVQIGDASLGVLIDAKSALPLEATMADGGTVHFLDFRKVGPFTLPFEIRKGDTVVALYGSRRVVSSPLSAPRGLLPTFRQGSALLGMVHVAREPAIEPVVPCSVGGIKVNCLIDTGNSSLGMSLELAERLGVDVTGEYEVGGIGRYITGIVTTGPLDVGAARFPTAHYVVLHDLHDYGYDVVLGADVLAHTRVVIDYAARTVAVADAAVPSPRTTIPLRFDGFMPVVGVQLGAIDLPLAIDTGDEATINVPYEYYAQHPGLFEMRGRREVAGIGGGAEQIVGRIASVRISTFDVADQAIAATRTVEPAASGHLGSGFLSHFTVTLDYTHARLGLTPRPNDASVHSE